MARKVFAALLGVVLVPLLALVILVAPGQATPAAEPVCATWGLRSITTGPGWLPEPAEGSEVASASEVKITKPEGGGTEFAAFDLEVTAPADNEIHVSVHYALGDGAATSAGAVRMFGYAEQDANTLTDAPDWTDVAEADTGNLLFTLPAGAQLGTLGVVYDASNSAEGYVTFTDMKVGNRPVSFTACPEPEPTATATPSPEPSASASSPAPAGTTAPPAAGGPDLPVTGVNLQQVVTGAILLVVAGVITWLVAPSLRRRGKTRFEA